MLTVNAVTDKIQVKAASAGAIDVTVTWREQGSGASGAPAGDLINITDTTTTDVIVGPGNGSSRVLRHMTICNKGVGANLITVYQTNGTKTTVVDAAVILPGGTFNWTGTSFDLKQGGMATLNQLMNSSAAINALNLVVLPADVTNNNGVANTMQDVTGFSFPAVAGQMFWFRYFYRFTTAAATTGSRWSINGPANPTFLAYRSEYTLTAGSRTFNDALTAYDLPAASNASAVVAPAGNIAVVEGFIQPSSNGNIIGRFASEILSSAVVAKQGSLLQWVRVV